MSSRRRLAVETSKPAAIDHGRPSGRADQRPERTALGNQDLQHLARAEQHASDVGSRAARQPARDPDALTTAAGDGKRSLSTAGRAYFEPLVGAPLGDAKIHVDDTAERVAQHAHAHAATIGQDVLVPPSRFAPETDEGRGLLAHELTHVTHAATSPATLFRDAADPHYPSPDEQKKVEKLLGRDTEIQPALPGDTSGPKVVDKKKTLSTADAASMASSFVAPIERWLDTHNSSTGRPLTSTPVTTLPDIKSAMAAAQKALPAIWAKFGKYLPATPPKLIEQTDANKPLPATNELAVLYRWKPDEAKTFIRNVAQTQCAPTITALDPLTTSSRTDVLDDLVPLLQADPALWQKIENAARNAVGGRETFGTRAIELTPYGDDPYSNAVHEMLHQLTHPAFAAVVEGAIDEAFTEYFTREVVPTSHGTYDVQKVQNILDAMGGPLPDAHVDSPEESLRRAYFQGKLDLIGWHRTEAEKAGTDIPSDTPEWDPAKAKTELDARNARALKAQDPHRNLIGVGIFYRTSGELLAGPRYARVFYRDQPVAHTQLYLEGQVVGTVKGEPRVGGSLGLGVDWQNPSTYTGVAVRAQGTGAVHAAFDPRVDLELVGKIGLRHWHTIRVGAEGIVFVPVHGGGDLGIGAAVTVELER
jgi:hypothetical protein